MIFAHTWQAVVDGAKTQTRRPVNPGETWEWYDGPVAVITPAGRYKWALGSTYAVQPGRGKKAVARIEITALYQQHLLDIDEQDAQAEGFRSRAAFLEAWDRINPQHPAAENPPVWVIVFRLDSESSDAERTDR